MNAILNETQSCFCDNISKSKHFISKTHIHKKNMKLKINCPLIPEKKKFSVIIRIE